MNSSLVKSCGILGGYNFVIALVISLLSCFCINSVVASVIIGILIIVVGIVCIILAFWRNDEGKLRFQYMLSGIVGIIGGLTLACLPNSFHLHSSSLNRFVVYWLFVSGLYLAAAMLNVFVSNKFLYSEVKSSSIDDNQQANLYIISNLVLSILLAICFAFSKTEIHSVFTDGFVYSIAIWFLAAIVGVGCGYLFVSKAAPLTGAYESNYDTTPGYDNVK